jgi:hypothetical protein
MSWNIEVIKFSFGINVFDEYSHQYLAVERASSKPSYPIDAGLVII